VSPTFAGHSETNPLDHDSAMELEIPEKILWFVF